MAEIFQVKFSGDDEPSGSNVLLPVAGSFSFIFTGGNSWDEKILWNWFVFFIFLCEFFGLTKSLPDTNAEQHLNLGMQHSMRLFRAQRNFYISGFAIFLTLVIRRLVTLISAQAALLAQSTASMRQAESATTAARTLLSQKKQQEDEGTAETDVVDELKKKLGETEKELVRERKDKEAMKSQAESLNKEYDRLTEEYSKLQKKVIVSDGKDD